MSMLICAVGWYTIGLVVSWGGIAWVKQDNPTTWGDLGFLWIAAVLGPANIVPIGLFWLGEREFWAKPVFKRNRERF